MKSKAKSSFSLSVNVIKLCLAVEATQKYHWGQPKQSGVAPLVLHTVNYTGPYKRETN